MNIINQQNTIDNSFIWAENHITEHLKKNEKSADDNKWITTGEMPIKYENLTTSDIKEKNKPKSCRFCNKEFISDKFHPGQIFCNEKCKDKYRWPGNKQVIKKICKGCNKEFICGKYCYNKKIYCSVICQGIHYRDKEEIKMRRKLRHNDRLKNDVNYRLKYHLRIRLNKALKGNYKSGSAIKDLGCDISKLKLHLESQFVDGMSWENHGLWHIDHKEPLSKFNLSDRQQLLMACHYTNLQPLWAKDNIKKSNK